MASSTTAARPAFGWAAILTAFALVGLTVVLVGKAQGERVSSEVKAAATAESELLAARRALELGTLEVVVVRMLDGVGIAGDRIDRLATAAEGVRRATSSISAIAEGDGLAAEEARTLLGDVEIEALEDPAEADLADLFDVGEDASRYSGASEVVITRRDAIQQLSFVGALPLHVMIEGIAADTSVNERAVDPSIAPFVDRMTQVVRTEGGWFGADAASPLDGSMWIDIDDASDMLPAATQRLQELTAASDLVEFDAWMRELGDGDGAPPFSLIEVLDAVDQLMPELADVLDEQFADEEATRLGRLAAQEAGSGGFVAMATAAGLLALVTFCLGVLSISRGTRASRERAKLAVSDALTGVGNRHELDETTRALTVDRRFGHHVVAMVDLDRFKMVNDVHGHAAGDAVLIEVASRLQRIASRFERNDPTTETTVIRLGGDEFLLTIHSVIAVNVDVVRAGLDEIRAGSIEHNGEGIDLGFSVGIVAVEGPHSLADLMNAADLAVYDDKAARSLQRRISGDVAAVPAPSTPA